MFTLIRASDKLALFCAKSSQNLADFAPDYARTRTSATDSRGIGIFDIDLSMIGIHYRLLAVHDPLLATGYPQYMVQ
jgi:hypothetical protein